MCFLHLSSVCSQRPIESTGGEARWQLLEPAEGAPRPAKRDMHSAVVDAASRRLLVFGGSAGQKPPFQSLLVLSLSSSSRVFFFPPLLFFRSSSCGLSFLVPRGWRLPERRLGLRPRGVLKGPPRRAPLLCSAPAPAPALCECNEMRSPTKDPACPKPLKNEARTKTLKE